MTLNMQPGTWVFNFIGKIEATGGSGLYDAVSKDLELSNNMVALSIAKAVESLKPKEKRFLSTEEASDRIHLSKSRLNKLRLEGGGPPYSKPSDGRVYYDVELLDAWITSKTLNSTAEYQAERRRDDLIGKPKMKKGEKRKDATNNDPVDIFK